MQDIMTSHFKQVFHWSVLAASLLFLGCMNHIASVDNNTGKLAATAELLNANTKKMSDELANDREYIEAITEQMKNMANSLNKFEKLAAAFSEMALASEKTKIEPVKNPKDLGNEL